MLKLAREHTGKWGCDGNAGASGKSYGNGQILYYNIAKFYVKFVNRISIVILNLNYNKSKR